MVSLCFFIFLFYQNFSKHNFHPINFSIKKRASKPVQCHFLILSVSKHIKTALEGFSKPALLDKSCMTMTSALKPSYQEIPGDTPSILLAPEYFRLPNPQKGGTTSAFCCDMLKINTTPTWMQMRTFYTSFHPDPAGIKSRTM